MRAMTRAMGLLLASFGLSSAAQQPAHAPQWDYAGEKGPEHWSTLAPEFSACAGRNQSPIDLDNFIEAELPPITFDYHAGGREVVNTGHSIQVNYDAGSSISLDGIVFQLKQFHFHTPSENQIDGKSFPMEAHFVHVDPTGSPAVVALMFEQGDRNPALDEVWKQIPPREGGHQPLLPAVAAADLLPANRDYYRYSGSMTTPPCSEGVRWLVLKQPITASARQLRALTKRLGHPNNRPVQPVGARPVLQ